MVETVILTQQTVEGFILSEDFDFYGVELPTGIPLESGKQYRVVWDAAETTVTAYSTSLSDIDWIALGNQGYLTGQTNEIVEPFVILAAVGGVGSVMFATDTKEEHTVAIYQAAEDTEPETPEGIVLKDRNGNDVAYYGIETVTFDTTTEGKQQTYTKGTAVDGLKIIPDFSGGDMAVKAPEGTLVRSAVIQSPAEEKTVDLAMADGDMIISPSAEGKLLSSVTVTKPETLTPENIAKDVDIAGIVGTFAGASRVKIATGSFSYAKAALTIAHNLGAVPDLIIIHAVDGTPNTTASNAYALMLGISSALKAKFPGVTDMLVVGHISTSSLRAVTYAKHIDDPYASAYGTILREANETTFTVGSTSTSNNFVLGTTYRWIAISGLA